MLVGNEEDLQKGLGIAGPEVAAKSKLDPSAFFGMIDQAVEKHPQIKVVATTLREVHSTSRHSWSAVAWINGQTYTRPTAELDILRPRGRRRRLRVRLLLWPAGRRDAGRSGQAGLGARRAADHVPRRHHHGDSGPGALFRQGRIGKDTEMKREIDITSQAAKIKLLLMDVDGVLTDGKLYYIRDGQGEMAETKGFDTQDGIALQWLGWKNIQTGVISGRLSPATEERARQVNMSYVYQGHIEKIPILEEILVKAGIDSSEVAYVGDDLTDVVIMHRVGLAIAPANARLEVKAAAHYVTQAAGGAGAIREVVELLLKAQNRWVEILRHYELC